MRKITRLAQRGASSSSERFVWMRSVQQLRRLFYGIAGFRILPF